MGKVSVVGAGMKSHPGVAARVFSTLGEEGINIEMISTSPIKISCVVAADAVDAPSARCTRLRARAPTRSRPSIPFGAARSTRMSYRVAVVGATGAVGTVMRAKLRERGVPGERDRPLRLRALRGPRARRRARPARSPTTRSRASTSRSSRAGGATSGDWAPRFVEAGAVVVDNSSRWRRDPEVPLVVSEVNPEALDGHRGLIANPNCSTMQLMVALKPIHDAAGHRAPDRLHLPVGLGHRREGGRRARGADPRGRCTGEPLPSRASTRTRSRSTSSAAPATSPTATTTPTRSAR